MIPDFLISNQFNIANLIDDEFSKFRLRVVTYDHITQTDMKMATIFPISNMCPRLAIHRKLRCGRC